MENERLNWSREAAPVIGCRGEGDGDGEQNEGKWKRMFPIIPNYWPPSPPAQSRAHYKHRRFLTLIQGGGKFLSNDPYLITTADF